MTDANGISSPLINAISIAEETIPEMFTTILSKIAFMISSKGEGTDTNMRAIIYIYEDCLILYLFQHLFVLIISNSDGKFFGSKILADS